MKKIECHTCEAREDNKCIQPPDLLGKCGCDATGQLKGCESAIAWIEGNILNRHYSGPYTFIIYENGKGIEAVTETERLADVESGVIWPRPKIRWSVGS